MAPTGRWLLLLTTCCALACSGAACSGESARERDAGTSQRVPASPAPPGMVAIPGGRVHVGADTGSPLETPRFVAEVAPFWLDADEVSVARFSRFVADTGWITAAERRGDGSVFDLARGEWRLDAGASWRAPLGRDAPPAAPDHPVTQVSWDDADAFCRWAGGRLPTEIEWEHAARGARDLDDDAIVAPGNVWQGPFPRRNDALDGFVLHAPIGSFPRDALGLADLFGNVWEWTASWLVPYAERGRALVPGPGSQRVLRGGSFLCARDACHGFRPSARIGATPESALSHVGFRCARDGS